jgi:hypothetical protein
MILNIAFICIGVVFCATCAVAAGSLWKENERAAAGIFAALGACVVLAGIGIAMQSHDDRPCVRYDTGSSLINGVSYPYKYCAQYGEWTGDHP